MVLFPEEIFKLIMKKHRVASISRQLDKIILHKSNPYHYYFHNNGFIFYSEFNFCQINYIFDVRFIQINQLVRKNNNISWYVYDYE